VTGPAPARGAAWARRLRRALRVVAVLVALAAAGVLVLGSLPLPEDFQGDERTAGAGAAGAGTGLDRPFPPMPHPPGNPPSGAAFEKRVELGRLLFFDPVLSGENDLSCATCHHPDLGFSDGRARSMGKGGRGVGFARKDGAEIRRAAPTLWNAAFNHRQFWDGRAATLEEQAKGPITSPDEMAQDPDELVRELRAIPEYARRFEEAFGGAVTFDHVLQAIAAFERTLLSRRSPFDRFAAGDRTALTPAERRGFNLFRSGKTRCFECHGAPTFANPDFKAIGVPDLDPARPDLGREEVAGGEGHRRAFKVPTLRNVALTDPYMHNGRFTALEEVIHFYARGGGPGAGLTDIPNLDDKIRPFEITAEETDDLVSFLHALTDESALPAFPERVPSGLPVVPRLENPGRALAARSNVPSPAAPAAAPRPPAIGTRPAPATIRVAAGESIQAAVDRAGPGDTIEVAAGTYAEAVTVDLDGITLRGAGAGADPGATVLDGGGRLSDAVIATGSRFTMSGFLVRDYTANGVVVQNAHDVALRDLSVARTGLYGVYPVGCTGVRVERVTVTGAADAGIYVGQSRDIVVRDCKAFANVTGIEIENSVDAVVESNDVRDNAGGILVFVLPNNPSKVGRGCRVVSNRVIDNNHPNFANPRAIVAKVPVGTGILVMAADDTEITRNEIRGNDSFGVAVVALDSFFPKGTTFDVGPVPERTHVHHNTYADNGRRPAEMVTSAGLGGADLLWDLSGWSNTWEEPEATRGTPILDARLPAVARRAAYRLLIFARDKL